VDSPPKVIQDLRILPSYLPIPSFGLVPVNAFVLKAKQPVLIDTGLRQDSSEFMDGLRSVIVWLLTGLAVLILVVAGLALRTSGSERTVRTADGAVWTVSDITAYARGRLDDEAGRRYCEDLNSEMPAEAVSKDQELLEKLTRDLCRQRLAMPW
jgi:hypothetical protein